MPIPSLPRQPGHGGVGAEAGAAVPGPLARPVRPPPRPPACARLWGAKLGACCPLVSTDGIAASSLWAHGWGTGKENPNPTLPPAPTSLVRTTWVTWARASVSVTPSLLKSKMGASAQHSQSQLCSGELHFQKKTLTSLGVGWGAVTHTLVGNSIRGAGSQGAKEQGGEKG